MTGPDIIALLLLHLPDHQNVLVVFKRGPSPLLVTQADEIAVAIADRWEPVGFLLGDFVAGPDAEVWSALCFADGDEEFLRDCYDSVCRVRAELQGCAVIDGWDGGTARVCTILCARKTKR